MAFVVELAIQPQGQHAVQINPALRIETQQAQYNFTARRGCRDLQAGEVSPCQLMINLWQCGFRPDDDRRAQQRLRQRLVALQDLIGPILIPLIFLGDISLHQCHSHRRTRWLSPNMEAQDKTRDPEKNQRKQYPQSPLPLRSPQEFQAGSGPNQKRAQPQHAKERRKARQGTVRLGITHRQPGEAGENPGTDPFTRHPGSGKHPQGPAGRATAQPRRHSSDQRGKQRQKTNQQPGQQQRQRKTRVAMLMDADEDPAHAKAELPQSEGITNSEGAARVLIPQQEEQAPQGQRRQPGPLPRRKGEYQHGARHQCPQRPQETRMNQAHAFTTPRQREEWRDWRGDQALGAIPSVSGSTLTWTR